MYNAILSLLKLFFNLDHIITMNIRDDLSKIIFKFCIITIATLVPAFADTTQFLSTSGSLQCVDSSQVIRKMRCNPSLTGCYFDCQQISNCTHVAVKSLKDISECYLIQSSPIESLVTKESYREALLLTALTQVKCFFSCSVVHNRLLFFLDIAILFFFILINCSLRQRSFNVSKEWAGCKLKHKISDILIYA